MKRLSKDARMLALNDTLRGLSNLLEEENVTIEKSIISNTNGQQYFNKITITYDMDEL